MTPMQNGSKNGSETNVQGLSEQLGSLTLDGASDPEIPSNAQSAGSRGATCSSDAEAMNTCSDADNHSIGSAWTSVSKEFEALKAINKATMAGLQTQLKILEKDETELYRHHGAGDLSGSSKMACGTEGGPGAGFSEEDLSALPL